MGRNDKLCTVMYVRHTDVSALSRVRNYFMLDVGYRKVLHSGHSMILLREDPDHYDKVFLMLEPREGFWEVRP